MRCEVDVSKLPIYTVYTHAYIYIHTYIHTHTHIYTYIHIYTYTHICIYIPGGSQGLPRDTILEAHVPGVGVGVRSGRSDRWVLVSGWC